MMTKYYLIQHSNYRSDVGSIFSVKEYEDTQNVLNFKFQTNDVKGLIELSALEYKYYEQIRPAKRIEILEKNIFKDICKLTPGDNCKFKINNIYLTVQILKKENRYTGILIKCKQENGEYCEITASSIEEIIKFGQGDLIQSRFSSTEFNEARYDGNAQNGFYMLSIKVVIHDAGSIIQAHNGTLKSLDDSHLFVNHHLINNHLIKLEKDEAMFLHKFPIDKRMKKHRQEYFKILKELQLGQECYLRSDKCPRTSFIITGKNVESELIKFDLKKKNNSRNIRCGVEMIDIKLPKGMWNSITDSDIRIKFIEDIYVANSNNVSDWKKVRINDKYEMGQLVQVGNFYGKIAFFVEEFKLMGIILDDEQVHKNHKYLRNILFNYQISNQPHKIIFVKINSVQNFVGEFHFKNDSCLIDENSIKYKSRSESTKFKINEIIKYDKNGVTKYFRIHNFWNLNGVQCLAVMKVILLDENVECEYLREIDACTVGEIETKFYMCTFIKPASIITFEKSSDKDFNVDDDVEFISRISDLSFRGKIKIIVKANGMLSAIIELSDEVDHDLVQCTINANDELFNVLGVEYAQYCIVPADILRAFQAREMELINQYFLDLFKCSNNIDLEIRIVQDIVQMNNKRFIKYIIGCKARPLKLDVHQYLLPLLIEKENIQLINLLLNHCDLTPISSQTFLNLANLALKIDDENLFKCAIENCKDKNALLTNGETFLTNLFKIKYPEELINKIISKAVFDPKKNNENDESPFKLACKMTMASIVEKIIPKTLSSSDKQIALNLIFEAEEKLVKSGQPLCDAWTIRNLINNTETRQTMECSICMDKEKNVVLECGHLFCDVCTEKLYKCPSCGKDIGIVRRIYLS